MYNKLYKIGLALGGGGARGFVHLGVIQALQEAGITPEIISGTSAGSMVAAMIASGHSPKECMEFFTDKKLRDFISPAISRKGFFDLDKAEELLQEFLGVKTFEELDIPIVITASDMNNVKPVHFRSGILAPCIIASCSVPVAFVPKEINGKEYVDGGAFMNLPVRPIRPLCKTLIAIDINSLDRSEEVTNMFSMAVRAFHIGLARNTDIDKKMADLVLEPQDMTQYNLFDIAHMWEIYEEGYNITKASLDRIEALL